MAVEALVDSLESLGDAVTRGGYRVRRIRDPGRALDASQQRALIDVFVDAAGQMVGAEIARYWEQRQGYFDELSEWWLVTHDREVVGWCGLKLIREGAPEALIYVDTLGFLPAHQRGGLATLLAVEPWVRISFEQRRPLTMAFRTQSPAVMRVAASIAGRDTYPHPSAPQGGDGERAVRVAAFLASALSPGHAFDRSCLVCRGVFSYMEASLYGSDFPWSGVRELDRLFADQVDVERGDAMIGVMLGTWRLAGRSLAVRRQTRRRLDRSSSA